MGGGIISGRLVWDNHACPPMDLDANLRFLPQLERFRAAGATVVSLNTGYGEMALEDHWALLAQMRRWILERPGSYRLIERAGDVELARASGQLGLVFDIEGAAPLDGDLDQVDRFYEQGVRWMLLAYNRANWAASGVHDEDRGLSDAGRALVQRMEKVGMVVCLSHTAYRSAFDALEMASKPMVFSHSNALKLSDHPRNIPDELIRACAAKGGVVGVNGIARFMGLAEASVDRLVDHMDHIASVGGPDAVGLGLDFVFDLVGLEEEKLGMANTFPPGLGYEQPTNCLPPEAIEAIAETLLRRGWRDAEISGALGANWLRVAKACWAD